MIVTMNKELNGIEVMFDKKPNVSVLENLKSNGFRWHKQKKIWYAKDNEKRRQLLEHLEEIKPKEITNKHGVKVGDIFVLSFGYSMTLYDFFQVVSITESSARIVEIVPECVGGDGYNPQLKAELGKKYPVRANSQWIKDQEKGDIRRTSISTWGNQKMVRIDKNHHAYEYKGEILEEDHWD